MAMPLSRDPVAANDYPNAKLLYAMVKQFDVRSINWNDIAGDIGITNGHAARMRFSRFRQVMEGTVPKTRQPRVTKTKSTTKKGKGAKAASSGAGTADSNDTDSATSQAPPSSKADKVPQQDFQVKKEEYKYETVSSGHATVKNEITIKPEDFLNEFELEMFDTPDWFDVEADDAPGELDVDIYGRSNYLDADTYFETEPVDTGLLVKTEVEETDGASEPVIIFEKAVAKM